MIHAKSPLIILALFTLLLSPCVQAEVLSINDPEKNEKGFSFGAILPLSGFYEDYGDRILKSLILAGGFFMPHRETFAELHIEDSQMQPEKARQGFERLTAREDLLAVIGPLSSEEALELAELSGRKGIPLLTLTKNEDVTGLSSYCFSAVPSSKRQLRHLAHHVLNERNINRIAILYPDVPFGQDAAHFFRDEIKNRGGRITHFISYEGQSTDFSKEIMLLLRDPDDSAHTGGDMGQANQRTAFDGLFIPDTAARAAQIVSQFSFYNTQGFQLFGGSGWNDPDTIRKHRDLFAGAVFVDGYFSCGTHAKTEAFADGYYAAYAREPDSLDAYAYDAMMLVMKALKDGMTSSRPLRDILAETRAYPGVRGLITASPSRLMDSEPFLITVVEGEGVRMGRP
ncbi:MAG: penicillin-binding protein activator [Syntrophales bacterium]|nr:penicillin-binding protein activator [Syntrophales bacterium]